MQLELVQCCMEYCRVSVIFFCLWTWFFHLQSHRAIYQFIRMQNSWDIGCLEILHCCCREYCSAAGSPLFFCPFPPTESACKISKFRMKNSWDNIGCLEILQRCREYCSAAGSLFWPKTWSLTPKESSCKISAHSVEKWLRYSQYKHLLRGAVPGWL